MKRIARTVHRFAGLLGVDPIRTYQTLRHSPRYLADYAELRRQRPKQDAEFGFGVAYPCLEEAQAADAEARSHYFHQDLLVASRIFVAQPHHHIDVGSRFDGFVAHVASFREITVLDIRPMKQKIRNVDFIQADLMKDVPARLVESCDSLSCLHALEHFGLGRYGDAVRWDGYRVGLYNMLTMLQPGGKLYLSVPIGPQRIEFNAHRVFSLGHLLHLFSGRLRVDRFSFVNDDGDLHENVVLDRERVDRNCGCSYGCGIFEMTKAPKPHA
jgi:Caenorhabditis protein of unknown function, DUF268